MTDETSEDERDVELAAIQSIFPELALDPSNSHAADLLLKVAPTDQLPLAFAPPRLVTPPPQISLSPQRQNTATNGTHHSAPAPPAGPETRLFTYLPSIHLRITLPDGYPDDLPPSIHVSSNPNWISLQTIASLQQKAREVWEEYGRTQVVFAYIDLVQQHAETAFRQLGQPPLLSPELKQPMIEFDCQEKKLRFELDTFDCGVCLEPKKGSSCYQLRSCGHVFCVSCLQDFYNSAITEGDVGSVKCLAPDCGKEHILPRNRQPRKPRALHPTELLNIPIDRAQVQRYIDIRRKKKFESDKSTIYCPRTFCQAPARSAKFAKYESATIENFPDSDSESEPEPAAAPDVEPGDVAAPTNLNASTNKLPADRLSICSKCSYAFCRICQRSWHGDFLNCLPPSEIEAELSKEDRASYDYIRLNTSPCPTCEAPCQKTMGCNHMRCFTCKTHFCYLCSSWLSAGNPYQHFNTYGTGCYMRLWELEEGDEGQDRNIFGGPRAAEQAAVFARQFDDNPQENNNNNNARRPTIARPRPENRNAEPNRARPPDADHALQRFLQMAANDEEDGWESDDMELFEDGGFG